MSGAFGSVDKNVSSLFALDALGDTSQEISKLQQQLTTGKAINAPAEDPAGFTISQGLQTQVKGSSQALSNANQAVSLIGTATAGLNQQTDILQKVRTIAVQAANGTNTATDLQSLQNAINESVSQITTVSQQTQFNGINLLDGSFSGKQFQVGANQGQVITASAGDTRASNLGMYQTAASGSYAGYIPATITPSPSPGNFSGVMTITGPAGTGSIAIPSGTSAIKVAANVNKISSHTGVTAEVQKPLSQSFIVSGTGNINFTLGNGVSNQGQTHVVSVSGSISSDTAVGMEGLVQSINSFSGVTGISASTGLKTYGTPPVTKTALQLTNASGNNINIENYNGSPVLNSLVGLGSGHVLGFAISSGTPNGATVESGINFNSSETFSLSGGSYYPLSGITASGIYTASGSTENGEAFTISPSGNFTSGSVNVIGSMGSGAVTVTSSGESAASIAASVNQISNITGVNAQAYTRVIFKVSGTGNISFTLGNGTSNDQKNSVKIAANIKNLTTSGLANLVQAINKNSNKTGILASVVSSDQLAMTSTEGNNISISKLVSTVTLSATNGGSGGGHYQMNLGSGGDSGATIQGIVNFQSANAISISGGNIIGLGSSGSLINLRSINLSTPHGAGEAVTIASYALQQLDQQSTQLGAVQQRVQSALSNEQSVNINDQSALSVIDSANIPKVSAKLTQEEILQQAGMSALTSSSKTMQNYLKLLS